MAARGRVAALGLAHWLMEEASEGRLYDEVAAGPPTRVALVLGCAPVLSDGQDNLFFRYRIEAAAALYHAGKIEHLLVSGDNHRADYNEPAAMAAALVARGVPAERIVCDYAGFSTLDSVVRARAVFGQSDLIVVSQEFHNRRALLIAAQHGLSATAFNARSVSARYAPLIYVRETFASLRVLGDLTLFRRQPRFLGPPVPVG